VEPIFFKNAGELREWFAGHHATTPELILGIYKKGAGIPSVTLTEAIDEALCVGWIDSVERRLDDVSYALRFTPRKARSNWSDRNIRRAEELIARGRMLPAGLAAFERRRK
jgi:uncharacterized protein YdeI (YjbR/CyaY-like superfamily)